MRLNGASRMITYPYLRCAISPRHKIEFMLGCVSCFFFFSSYLSPSPPHPPHTQHAHIHTHIYYNSNDIQAHKLSTHQVAVKSMTTSFVLEVSIRAVNSSIVLINLTMVKRWQKRVFFVFVLLTCVFFYVIKKRPFVIPDFTVDIDIRTANHQILPYVDSIYERQI